MIFIITGPSGVGKNTIINELSNHIDFHFSTSFTTRPKRDNEIEGQDYYFITCLLYTSPSPRDEL